VTVSKVLLAALTEVSLDEKVPAGHYFVGAEHTSDGPSTILYLGHRSPRNPPRDP
jgi:hypothetical protein